MVGLSSRSVDYCTMSKAVAESEACHPERQRRILPWLCLLLEQSKARFFATLRFAQNDMQIDLWRRV